MTQQMSGTNARFLQTPVVLSEIMRVMEPNLVALDMIPAVDTGGQPVVYGVKGSKSADAKKQQPRMTTPSAKFAEVQISRMTKATAITSAEGLSIRFDKSALTLPAGKDMIADGLATVGYWMAEYLNTAIYQALDAGSTDDGIAPTAQWDQPNATPILDLLNFKNAMIREGYPYRMTDIFVDGTNFSELEAFLIGSELPAYQNAVLNMPLTDQIVIPIEGKPVVHRMLSGVTHGDMLGIDARNKTIAALYYHNDATFGTPATITYETVTNGSPVTKTVQNFGLNVHTYFEDDTHDTVVQVWSDTTTRVKDAFGIISGDSI